MAVEAEFGGLKVPLQTILRYTFKMLYEADVVHVPRTKHDTCQIFEKLKELFISGVEYMRFL